MSAWRALLTAVTAMLLLVGCGVVDDDDPSGDPTVTETENSRLDREGVAAIEESGVARFDLRDLAVTRDEVGLEDERLGPIVGGPGDDPLSLVLRGPEATEEVTTRTFSVAFDSVSEEAGYVTWFESYDSEAEAFEALESATQRWGLRPDDLQGWRDTLARGGEQERSLALGVSPAGFVTQVTVRGREDAGQTHQWMVLLDPALYEPDTLERIRRTGTDMP